MQHNKGDNAQMAKLLIVEDQPDQAQAISDWVATNNHAVDLVLTGEDALDMLSSFEYDLIILDWNLPGASGLDVLRQYRAREGLAAILMLTACDAIEQKEAAFDFGADDYLTKPFAPQELTARIRAMLRRPRLLAPDQLKFRDLVLDVQSRQVLRGGAEIKLQPLEMAVLEFFLRHPNEVFSPEMLLDRIWESGPAVSIDSLYTCIRKIRKKIDVDPEESIITTVHSVGYRLNS
jgi:DNA-binding response OmpR family regulator